MKRIAFLSFLFFAVSSTVGAQSSGEQVFAARLCAVSSFSFPCPAGYEIKNAIGSDAPYLAIETKNKITTFAYAPTTKLGEQELILESLSKVFAASEVSFDKLEKKNSSDFWGDDKWSKYEVSKFAQAALDGTNDKAYHFQYVHLVIEGKQILAGFIYDPVRTGETATAWFERWRGGGNGGATGALNSLILSITKEPRRTVPGGPPPAAPARKPNTN